MRILVLTLMMSFLSHSAFGAGETLECCICYSPTSSNNNIILSCSTETSTHNYHYRCLMLWFNRCLERGTQTTCPMSTCYIAGLDCLRLKEKSSEYCCFCCPQVPPIKIGSFKTPWYFKGDADCPLNNSSLHLQLGNSLLRAHLECAVDSLNYRYSLNDRDSFFVYSLTDDQKRKIVEQARQQPSSPLSIGRKTTEYEDLYKTLFHSYLLWLATHNKDSLCAEENKQEQAIMAASVVFTGFVLYGILNSYLDSDQKDKNVLSFMSFMYISLMSLEPSDSEIMGLQLSIVGISLCALVSSFVHYLSSIDIGTKDKIAIITESFAKSAGEAFVSVKVGNLLGASALFLPDVITVSNMNKQFIAIIIPPIFVVWYGRSSFYQDIKSRRIVSLEEKFLLRRR